MMLFWPELPLWNKALELGLYIDCGKHCFGGCVHGLHLQQRSAGQDGDENARREEGAWSDAAWLLSVAFKALF